MHRPLRLLALIWLPFLSLFAFASPALTTSVGDSYPHIAFHLLAPALLIWAFVMVRAHKGDAPTRTQRALRGILTVTLPAAVLGNLVELVAAVQRLIDDGGQSRLTPDLFEGPGLHAVAANLTIPSLLLSMLTAVAIVVVTAAHRRRVPASARHTAPQSSITQR